MRILSSAPDVEQAPGVVVMMHGPGLDRFLEDRVAELARHGYAAAAPDLYHRQPNDDVDTMTRVGRLRDDEIVADVDAEAVAHGRPVLDDHRSYGCRYTGSIRSPLFRLKQLVLDT